MYKRQGGPRMNNIELPVEFLFGLTLPGFAKSQHEFSTAWGRRRLTRGSGGFFKGPRVEGEVIGGLANDWGAATDEGLIGIDAQMVLRTTDGTPIFMTYLGRIGADGRMRIAPLFEVSDGPHVWLTQVQAVGLGNTQGEDLHVDVYALK